MVSPRRERTACLPCGEEGSGNTTGDLLVPESGKPDGIGSSMCGREGQGAARPLPRAGRWSEVTVGAVLQDRQLVWRAATAECHLWLS